MMKKARFTLIEVLVVVAIIGILASLLLPTLRKARKTSKTSLSVNNLKQIYMASYIYADNNNGYLFNATSNHHPAMNNNIMNWPRIAYEAMTGEMLPLNSGESVTAMNNGLYAEVMFCPVLRETRGPAASQAQSHGDYSLNRHFLDDRRISDLVGKIEPFMASTTAKTSVRAYPQLNRGTYAPNTQGHMVYEYSNDKTIASYIDGQVTFVSIPEGSAISDDIWQKSTFK
jgi:prepilin-type N-terminal cleavage/methylation domain-containing protein